MKYSPLDAQHRSLNAKMVPFGGWEMPLAYADGTLAEHAACRTAATMFDVSHLGTVRVEGEGALDRLQFALTNDLAKIAPGRAQYTHLLSEDDGSVLDDIIVWWVDDQVFDVMPNASNTDRVVSAIGGIDTTATRAVIAVQGPEARRLVSTFCPEAADVPRFHVRRVEVCGHACVVAGTGYTGEDGIEIAVPNDGAADVWNALIDAGVTQQASERVTRCVSKLHCPCMVMNWVRGLPRCKQVLSGLSRGVKPHFVVVRRLKLRRIVALAGDWLESPLKDVGQHVMVRS